MKEFECFVKAEKCDVAMILRVKAAIVLNHTDEDCHSCKLGGNAAHQE